MIETEFLDGNTLDYRALQADGRNLNQSTVVKLLPTDYHAARILRGDEGRVLGETDSAEALPRCAGALMGSPYLDFQERNSPAFNITDSQWSYVTSSSYTASGGYQPACHASLTPCSSSAYQAVTISNPAFIPQAAIAPPLTLYQTVPSATSTTAHTTHYQYNDPAMYYPAGAAFDNGESGYTGFIYSGGGSNGHAYTMGYDWPPDAIGSPPTQPNNMPNDNRSSSNNHNDGRLAVVLEKRKILIRDLQRDGLSAAVIPNLLIQHAGIGEVPGQIERIEIRINRDGRARGTAYVTFATEELATAAVAALDGRKVAGSSGGSSSSNNSSSKRLSARLVVEGVSPEGSEDGASASSTRLNRRLAGSAGGDGGRGAGRGGFCPKKGGRGGNATKSSYSSQDLCPLLKSVTGASKLAEASLPQPGRDTAASVFLSVETDGQKKRREERPIIVDGSGGRWKKDSMLVMIDGSAGLGKPGSGGHRSSRH